MLALIDLLVELLFRILEGLVLFFRNLIPLLTKLVFALSPFLLLTFVAYLFGGVKLGLIVGGMVIVLMVIGLTYAYANQLTGTTLSGPVVIAVLLIDLGLVTVAGFRTSWFSTFRTNSGSASTGTQSSDPSTTREQLLLDLLKKSISDNNHGEIRRAITGLVSIKAKSSVPFIIEALRTYYPKANTNPYTNDEYQTSTHCMDALADLGATEGCVLFAEIAVKNPLLTRAADTTSDRVCK